MGVFHHPSTFLFISILLIPPLFADNNNSDTKNQTNNDNVVVVVVVDIGNINASNPSPSAPVVDDEEEEIRRRPNSSSFKPSIAAIIGVLTTLFSVTFLLLLYAKHCKRNSGRFIGYSHGSTTFARTVSARKNSGISRAVVESLPLFRFGSLSGSKDGLECAVCLTRFEPSELLRLLPKCKHAFHVECVDTWLDAHSTCPLCRYRVDPEDILLIIEEEEENSSTQAQDPALTTAPPAAPVSISSYSCFDSQNNSGESECSKTRRVSGRHSYAAGERQRTTATTTTSFRRSLDSFTGRSSNSGTNGGGRRKDGLLLSDEKKRLLEHRIIVSGTVGVGNGSSGQALSGLHQRWSDVQPSDLLYLRLEMIISQNRKLGTGSSVEAEAENKNTNKNIMIIHSNSGSSNNNGNGNDSETEKSIGIDAIGCSGSIIKSRSVSEITGLSRFSSKVTMNNNNNNSNSDEMDGHQRRQGQTVATAGLVSRWLAWISATSHSTVQSQSVSTSASAAFP